MNSKKSVGRNPKWTEEELILALDLYMDIPRGQISSRHPKIIDLSATLNRLRSADQIDPSTYRNANGTALKLHNFSRFDPSVQFRGMSNGGKLEEILWERFKGSRTTLRDAADAIRSKTLV